MTEKLIDDKLCRGVKKRGGLALKLTSLMFSGFPDRTILMSGGRVCFAELKSTGKKLRARQALVKAVLRRLGFKVYVIDSQDDLDLFFNDIDNHTKTTN